MRRVLANVISLMLILGLAATAAAGAEATVGETASGGTGGPAGEESIPLDVRWKNDLVLSSGDGDISIRIRGNLHFDSRFFRGDGSNTSQFDIRRARIDFQGRLYRCITFRLQAELADSPYLRNAWADYRFGEGLHLRGGQMKPPFSTSWWTTDGNVNFLERGAGTPVYPFFDRGWWLWGDLFGRSLTWNLAGFTGAGIDVDQPRGDVDDHKDWFAKLFAAPFRERGPAALEGLHLSLQGSRGRQTVPTARFEEKGYRGAILDDRFWTWETERTGNGEIERRDRWGAELHYLAGPCSVSSEYLVTRYRGISVFAADGTPVIQCDGSVRSWSSWAGWFITGERKRVGNFGWRQPSPHRGFDPRVKRGPGAWEVLLRYTRTSTSAGLFEETEYAGDSYCVLAGAPDVNEYTVGLNWTWNPMVRWQLNVVRLDGEGLRTGSASSAEGTRRVDRDEMVALRMIFRF